MEIEDPKAWVDRPEGVVVMVDVSDVLLLVELRPVVVESEPGEAVVLPTTVVDEDNDELVLVELVVNETEVLDPDELLEDMLKELEVVLVDEFVEGIPSPLEELLLVDEVELDEVLEERSVRDVEELSGVLLLLVLMPVAFEVLFEL